MKKLPPGPMGLPIVGSLFSCIDTAKFATNLSQRYGSISMAYIGFQRFVFLHDIKSINTVLANEYASGREHGESFMFHHAKAQEMMTPLVPYSHWRSKRKIFQSVMLSKLDSSFVNRANNKSLQHVFASMDECIKNNKSWNVMENVKYIQFHFIWYSCFGTFLLPGSEEQEKLINFVFHFLNELQFDSLFRYLKLAQFLPSKWMQLLFPTMNAFESYLECLLKTTLNYDNAVFDVNDKKWAKHFQQARVDKNSCVVAKLIAEHRHNPTESSTKLSILQEIAAFWLGGVDTTIHSNEYALVLLAKYPKEQELIYAELFGVFGNDVKMEKYKLKNVIQKLHYFRAFINESIRLANVAPIGVPHYNGDRPIKIDNFIIPKGTVIISDLQTANLNDEHWKRETNGEAKKLCLKAWLDNNNKFTSNAQKDTLMSFSTGPRNCAGKALAMRGLYSIMAKLILSYKFEIADGNVHVEMKQKFEFTQMLYPKIPLKISRR